MKKNLFFFLTLATCFSICLSCVTYADPIPFSDNPDAIQAASNSVVMLNCYERNGNLYSSGSAFSAFEENVFVTNYHVIDEEAFIITALTESGEEFNISTIVAYDPNSDIAIVRADEDTEITLLALGSSSSLGKGEKVTTIGSPLGLINTVSTGLYSGAVEDGQTLLQFSAPISAGSSGGALFNDNGEVIGITSASFEKGQNLNLAIPIENVIEIWNNHFDSTSISLLEFYNLHEHVVTIDTLYSDIDYFLSPNAPKKVTIEGYITSINKDNCEISLVNDSASTPTRNNYVVLTNVNSIIMEGLSVGDHVKTKGKIVTSASEYPIIINAKTSMVSTIE